MTKQMLVCEDHPFMQELVEIAAKKHGIEVSCTDKVEDLVAIAKSGRHFDFVTLDYNVIGGDTLAFCVDLGNNKHPHLKGSAMLLISDNEESRNEQEKHLGGMRIHNIRKVNLLMEVQRAITESPSS